MFWCNICKNLSRNDFPNFFEKNMVLVDYIGIFFTFPNTLDRCQTASLWFPSILLKKISKTTIIIDGPSSLFIRADLSRSELSAGRVVWYPIHCICMCRSLDTIASYVIYKNESFLINVIVPISFWSHP